MTWTQDGALRCFTAPRPHPLAPPRAPLFRGWPAPPPRPAGRRRRAPPPAPPPRRRPHAPARSARRGRRKGRGWEAGRKVGGKRGRACWQRRPYAPQAAASCAAPPATPLRPHPHVAVRHEPQRVAQHLVGLGQRQQAVRHARQHLGGSGGQWVGESRRASEEEPQPLSPPPPPHLHDQAVQRLEALPVTHAPQQRGVDHVALGAEGVRWGVGAHAGREGRGVSVWGRRDPHGQGLAGGRVLCGCCAGAAWPGPSPPRRPAHRMRRDPPTRQKRPPISPASSPPASEPRMRVACKPALGCERTNGGEGERLCVRRARAT
jgi:hypothetical protein